MAKREHAVHFQGHTAGTASGAIASVSASSGKRHYVTDATFYSDKDSVIAITGGSDGDTNLWEGALDISVVGNVYSVSFDEPLIGNVGKAVKAKVASSTSDCSVTVHGYTL